MNLPLKMLIEECIENYKCSDEKILDKKWITEIRMWGTDKTPKENVLYVVVDNCKFPSELFGELNVFVIMPFHLVENLPKGYQWIAIFSQEDIWEILGKMQDLFQEFERWYLNLYTACSLGCNLQEILSLSEDITQNCIYIADMSFKILAYTKKDFMMETGVIWRYQMLHGYLPVHVMKGMIESGEFEELNGFREADHYYSKNFSNPFAIKNIYRNNKPQVHVFVVDSMKRPSCRDIAIAQLLGEFIEKHFFLLSDFNLNRVSNNYETFFCDVISGRCVDEEIIQKQLSLYDWNLADTYCMAIIDINARDLVFTRTIMYELECEDNLGCFMKSVKNTRDFSHGCS
jgi:hypothetical protein